MVPDSESTGGQNTSASAGHPLTFGEKAVGLSFNPSGDPKVAKIKALYAEVIDLLSDGNLDNGATGLAGRFLGRAINDAVAAQMWAVKAVTFKD